ncbi:hypothetical protein QYM36_008487, partial [Artemia franciscana]
FVRKWREIQESEARKYIIIEHTEESSLKKNKKKKKKTDHEMGHLAIQLLEHLLEKKEEINIQTAETEETAESEENS